MMYVKTKGFFLLNGNNTILAYNIYFTLVYNYIDISTLRKSDKLNSLFDAKNLQE